MNDTQYSHGSGMDRVWIEDGSRMDRVWIEYGSSMDRGSRNQPRKLGEPCLGTFPGEHGSTYGGNPLACKVATAALEVLRDEKLSENSIARGNQLRTGISSMINDTCIESVRGRGLLNAIVIDQPKGGYGDQGKAWDVCLAMRDHGLLAKPTHGNIIRFAPCLTISEQQIDDCLEIIEKSVKQVG